MEEKVKYTLKIIDGDGDTFAKRAEMYYRKRPEIVNFVEEAFRSYRALAERYDHLSTELQSANHMIATAFPEHVPFPLVDDDDDDGDDPKKPPKHLHLIPSGTNIPQVPEVPKKEFKSQSLMVSSKKGPDVLKSSVSSSALVSSGLSKEEALEEIDKIHKGILVLQTEKEFVRSSYEQSYEKYWNLENEVEEMQKRVCSLQDEVGVGAEIEDAEARTLVASTALSSCKETIAKLEETQRRFSEDAEIEKGRIDTATEIFEALKTKFEINVEEQAKKSFDGQESSYESVKESREVDLNENLSNVDFAQQIDELVERVVSLETTALSHTALVKTLRTDTDELHEQIRGVEEDKACLVSDSIDMKKRITALEYELSKVRNLFQRVEDQNKNLQKHLTEANTTAKDLSGKLQEVKMDEDVEEAEDEERRNWRQLLPADGMEDREKVLLDEYSSVLRDYREVKRKLSEVEKKNRDGFFELALQLRELKNAVSCEDVDFISYARNQKCPARVFLIQGDLKRASEQEKEDGFKVKFAGISDSLRKKIPTVEEKVRGDIDAVLEENMNSVHTYLDTFLNLEIGVRSSAASSLHSLRVMMMESGAGFAAMEERISPGSFFQFPLSGFRASPNRSPCPPTDRERYLTELLQERQKLGPFLQVMPNCCRLLNQEIRRVSSFPEPDRYEHGSPFRSLGQPTNGKLDLEGWSMMQAEENCHLQRASPFRAPAPVGWIGMPGLPNPPIVKKVIRLDVPVDKYPSYNFVGRILGPRGNSLKRVELATHCRVFIRGRGSVKDTVKEEKLKGKPGYEHLCEPLHVLIEAELPEDIINSRLEHAVHFLESLLKPMDESMDHYKREQLKELAALNGTLREESPSPSLSPCLSPSMSPFNSKRAKTGQ
ncbi:K Homology domain [Arabidopsis thaliana x Arabidopsis arenosa]|uniref:K Homology domain n=1 Tax=Arabidopsis thaliana x Arabidopsis arenosa TaxID=1240361 RepID=A0A8T2BUS4_9BRAS|nr:K Homology domain [Arabidopsis thaliana x Arabidopsis arenosa]